MERKIIIAGRKYAVEEVEGEHRNYLLHGARGALYGLVRLVEEPDYLMAINLQGVPRPCRIGGYGTFSDANGQLEPVN